MVRASAIAAIMFAGAAPGAANAMNNFTVTGNNSMGSNVVSQNCKDFSNQKQKLIQNIRFKADNREQHETQMQEEFADVNRSFSELDSFLKGINFGTDFKKNTQINDILMVSSINHFFPKLKKNVLIGNALKKMLAIEDMVDVATKLSPGERETVKGIINKIEKQVGDHVKKIEISVNEDLQRSFENIFAQFDGYKLKSMNGIRNLYGKNLPKDVILDAIKTFDDDCRFYIKISDDVRFRVRASIALPFISESVKMVELAAKKELDVKYLEKQSENKPRFLQKVAKIFLKK